MKNCLFCKIVSGEEAGYKLLDDEVGVAFLDQRPLFPGHCLLVPRRHFQTLDELPQSLVGPLFRRARWLARAVEEGLEAEGSFVAINNRVSQSVPHLHIHVVPRRRKDGLKGFFWPRNPYRDTQHMVAVQQVISERLRLLVASLDDDE